MARTRTGPQSVHFYCDASGIDGISEYLDNLGDTVQNAIRPAAQAGAQVFYDRVKANVAGMGRVSGNLSDSIYQAFMPESSETGKTAYYRVSWNYKKAPHGRLLEWGWVQRYQVYVNKRGEWKTAIRPEKRGTKPPRRRASQAEKDAYYVPRANGPVQWVARSFVRRALSARGEALEAMRQELARRIYSLYYGGA